VYQNDEESDSSEPTKRESTKRVEGEAPVDSTPNDLVKKWAKKSA
jgi:hypothetical protein